MLPLEGSAELRGLCLGLAAVPFAAVVIDDHGSVRWANDTAFSVAGPDVDLGGRLFETVARCEPVCSALRRGRPASGPVNLPMEAAVTERVVSAAPVASRGVVVASFVGESLSVDEDEARQRLEAMLEHTSEMITVLDAEARVRFSNAAAGRLTGIRGSDVNGLSAFDLVHPDDLDTAAQAWERALAATGEDVPVELRLQYGDGSWRHVEVRTKNLLGAPGVDGIVVSLRDVTDTKHAALALLQAYERERANAARLTELDRLKDDFLATVSHELRTPLAAIVGFADLIRRKALDEETTTELIDRIAASAAEMRAMVDNVLDFSALDASSVGIDAKPHRLRDVVETVLSGAWHQLAAHRVDNRIGDERALADGNALGHVVRNLVTNAAKYSRPGSTITLEALALENEVLLSVTDTGIGIEAAEIEHIFDRFYRAPSAAFSARGSGIGLNIAKRYVELMGGTLFVVSTPGVGSTFTVALPSARADWRSAGRV